MSKTFLEALTSVGKNLQSGVDKLNETKADLVNVSAYGTGSAAISSAILTAITMGAKGIYLKSGEWTITEPILVPSNFVVSGCGWNTVIKIGPDYGATASNGRIIGNSDTTDGNSNITVCDLSIKIEDGQYVYSTNNTHPRGVLSFYKVDGVTVDNVNIYRVHTTHINDTQPMWFYDCSNITIKNSKIYQRDTQLNYSSGGVWFMCGVNTNVAYHAKNITITDNTFDCYGDETISLYVNLGSFTNVTIERNTLLSQNGYVLGLYTSADTDTAATTGGYYCFNDIKVLNNVISGCIMLHNKIKDLLIDMNTFIQDFDSSFNRNASSCVEVSYSSARTYDINGVVVIKNVVKTSFDVSSYTAFSLERIDNLKVEDNEIYSYGTGVKIAGKGNNPEINRNTFYNIPTAIDLSLQKARVVGNRIYSSTTAGISIKSNCLNGALIKDNLFKECTRAISIEVTYEISVSSRILANEFYMCGKNIDIASTCPALTGKILSSYNNIECQATTSTNYNLITDNTEGEARKSSFVLENNKRYTRDAYGFNDVTA